MYYRSKFLVFSVSIQIEPSEVFLASAVFKEVIKTKIRINSTQLTTEKSFLNRAINVYL